MKETTRKMLDLEREQNSTVVNTKTRFLGDAKHPQDNQESSPCIFIENGFSVELDKEKDGGEQNVD